MKETTLTTYKILIVEDEKDLNDLLHLSLMQEGYETAQVFSGDDVEAKLKIEPVHLILLDIMLPGKTGFEVCEALKKNETFAKIPVIMMTALGGEEDIIKGLELGADDYITKPFSIPILKARMVAVLRRYYEEEAVDIQLLDTIQREGICIDLKKHAITIDGVEEIFTTTEFRLLHHLMTHPGWVYTRNQLIDSVKGEDSAISGRNIDVIMVSLRKKIGAYSPLIETVRGVGYRFKE